MYTTRLLRNILVSVSKNQRKKSRPNKKWVDMQYLITFARACFSVGKKNNRQERFFVSKSEMFYFRDRSIKNPIILVEFDDQYQCCCSEASVVISIVRSWEVKKRLDHIMVSWELGLRTDFFPAGPAGTLWWTLRENGLLEFLRTLATHNAARVQLESQSMRWFFYANRHQSVAFQPLRLLYYLTKNQSSKYFEVII